MYARRVDRLVIAATAGPLALRAGGRLGVGVAVPVAVAVAVAIGVAIAVSVISGVARDAGSVRLGERADAVADPVLPVGKGVLALLHALRNLLTPYGRIQASGRAGTRDGDRGRRHGDAAHQFHSEGRAGAPNQGPGSRRPALDGPAGRDRFA